MMEIINRIFGITSFLKKHLLCRKEIKNTKLQTRIIACSLSPAPPSVLAQNITISFTLQEVGVHDFKLSNDDFLIVDCVLVFFLTCWF